MAQTDKMISLKPIITIKDENRKCTTKKYMERKRDHQFTSLYPIHMSFDKISYELYLLYLK